MRKALFRLLIAGVSFLSFFAAGYHATHPPLPQPGQSPEFYSTQTRHDLQLTFLQAIRQAEHSIFLFTYSLADPTIIRALRTKSEKGLDVRVICDSNASSGVANKLGQNVQTYYRKGKGLMHQKILLTDGCNVWIGSANMTRPSLKIHGNLVIGLHSEDFGQTIIKKAQMMATAGKVKTIEAERFLVGGQPIEMWFLPDNADAIKQLQQLIQTAEKSLKIAMFTWTRLDLAQEIIDSKHRGVDVQVIIDQHSGSGVSSRVADHLRKGGVPVRLSTGQGLLHHKLMIIDNKILVNGSANWTNAAFSRNDDCFLILRDLNKKQQRHLHRLWNVMTRESTPCLMRR
ncbi:MAG: phospholipase D-like domain-containing protein [Waddliaceae bacterium]